MVMKKRSAGSRVVKGRAKKRTIAKKQVSAKKPRKRSIIGQKRRVGRPRKVAPRKEPIIEAHPVLPQPQQQPQVSPEMRAGIATGAKPQKIELPAGYGENRIVLLVRDPHWVHAYWEITDAKRQEIEALVGVAWYNVKKILRVYDITDLIFNGTNAHRSWDIEINDYANNWYIHVEVPDRSWCVDIGVIGKGGEFLMLARSNVVATPRDSASHMTDEEWMIIEEDFRKLYVSLGDFGSSPVGLEEMKKRLRMEMGSGNIPKKK